MSLLCVLSNCFYLRKWTAVHTAMSASWIGVADAPVQSREWYGFSRLFVLLRCFVFAVWAQTIWTVVNPGGWHATWTRLNQSEWRSSAKLRLQGIKPGYLCERTGRSRWQPWVPPPSVEWQSVGDLPLAGSVSGLVKQDVSRLRVLGNVRRQTVELLDRLRVDFLQKKKRHMVVLDKCSYKTTFSWQF